ncbi:hypothetical protein WJ542_12360 [Paraburkholderia sp. B3]|uniref:hypothetical protein n=1 Tax=Paraburkholderia sp. B3 TaxID=3134791 RepID=UPI003982D336
MMKRTRRAIALGLIVSLVLASPAALAFRGMARTSVTYEQCGPTWYQPQYVGTQVRYVVVAPPG